MTPRPFIYTVPENSIIVFSVAPDFKAMVFRGLRPRQEAVRMAIEPKKYETLYLVRPDISPEDLLTIQNRVEQSVAGSGGEMIKSEKWAERDLAYRIENYTRGTYYIAVYAAESKAVTDIERYFNLSKNNVLRFMTVKYIEEEQRTAGGGVNVPPQPSEQEDQSAFQPPSSESESQAEGNGEPPQEAAEQVEGDEGQSQEAAEQVEGDEGQPQEAAEQVEGDEGQPQEAAEQVQESEEPSQGDVDQPQGDEEKTQGGDQS